MSKSKLVAILGIIIVVLIILYSPFERESSPLTDALRIIGDRQSEASEDIAIYTVESVEGSWVGEHQIKGANWAIPNILRHLMGVE